MSLPLSAGAAAAAAASAGSPCCGRGGHHRVLPGLQTLSQHERLLGHLHLRHQLLLLLLQLLDGRRAGLPGAAPEVRLLEEVDLELLLKVPKETTVDQNDASGSSKNLVC